MGISLASEIPICVLILFYILWFTVGRLKMDKYIISIQTFENIIKNLVKLEEEQDILIDQFFSKSSHVERTEMACLLEEYIKQINQLLCVVDKRNTADKKLPFIIIGCEIEVEDMCNQIFKHFKLVSPLEESIKFGDVSIFSPLGKALLLKKVGDIVDLNISFSNIKYKILSINL
ncbi:MAG TPA: transcription elongation factor GreAB [Desulfotomaculum sp.]|nr:transcription elongation factor GreAB [Desulfotomaculum sp.]